MLLDVDMSALFFIECNECRSNVILDEIEKECFSLSSLWKLFDMLMSMVEQQWNNIVLGVCVMEQKKAEHKQRKKKTNRKLIHIRQSNVIRYSIV